ncbi:hypothetical protein BH09PAT3_BH09PAT3_0020 [soil metagenome]
MAASKKPMADKKSASNSPRTSGVFDVSKPGKSGVAASSTSRQIIIKHSPMNDPMMTTATEPDAADRQTAPLVKPAAKLVIKPLHDAIPEDEPAAVPEPASPPVLISEFKQPAASAQEQTVEEPVTETDSAQSKPLVSEAPLPPTTLIADVAEEPVNIAVPSEAEARESDKKVARDRAARLAKMIEEEEYFLPIQTLEERRSRRVAIFGLLLIIVLAVAWYDIALDAGLLSNTYNLPHTSFFTVKS